MDLIVREKLLAYKKTAQDKLHEGKFLKEKEIILTLASVLPVTNSLTLPEVLKHDLRNLNVFAAVANWCDPDSGIAKTYPEVIMQIAEALLPKSEPKE